MNRMLIDTNIYSSAMRGEPEVIRALQQASEIGFCAVSIGELLSGFKAGKREADNRAELAEFLDSPRVRLHSIDEATAEYYAAATNALRAIGKPIPTNDLWIGSVALQHGLKLYTKDRHFRDIPGLLLWP